MSIVAAELKWYKSKVITNTNTNGGIMSINEVVDGVKNNIFPDVSQAERLAGIIRYRKVFAKLVNAANEILINPGFHIKNFTPAQDRVELFMGTHTDVQGDITGSEQHFGAGSLTTDVSAGSTTFAMTLEDSSQNIFEPTGNTVWIGNNNNSEYHTNVSASQSGDQVTLTLDTGSQLANNYTVADETVVSSVIYGVLTELKPVIDPVTATSIGTGDYDDTTNPVEGDNIGSVEDTFTLTFTSSTDFDCVGAVTGSVGSGNISSDFAPTNTDFSTPLFTLLSAGWIGSWAAGDTLTIPTHPASQGIWCKQTVPAGTNSFSGDNFKLRFGGESA
jgi:hypothetical protein